MMKHAWDNYATYAWGKNELRPISHKGHSASIFGSGNFGASIVDGLDTLYIMGFMDEFKRGRDWVEENLNLTGVVITHTLLFLLLFPPDNLLYLFVFDSHRSYPFSRLIFVLLVAYCHALP